MEDSTIHGDGCGHCGARVRVGDVRPFPNLKPDKAQSLKPLEEASEVFGKLQIANYYIGSSDRVMIKVTADGALDEIADCIFACCNLAHALGCEDLTPYMAACEERNRERGRYENKR